MWIRFAAILVVLTGLAPGAVARDPEPRAMTREAFVAQVAEGSVPRTGEPVEAGGLLYVADPECEMIRDLPGWCPVLPARPEHFGAKGNGGDETDALAAAFSMRDVRLTYGRVYGFKRLVVPPETVVTNDGAILRYVGGRTRDVILDIGRGSRWDRLFYRAGEQAVRDARAILIRGDVTIEMLDIEADMQFDAAAVHIVGDDVDIGMMRSRNFGRPLLVQKPGGVIDGFRLGWFEFESIMRGIRFYDVTNFEVGGGRQWGRSPLGPNEKPGRNNLLLSGISHGRFGPMDLADAPEHAIRFGGGGGGAGKISHDIAFAPMTIRRASASSIKLNPGRAGRVRNVRFGEVTIIDPFWQTGKNAKASHMIRISHSDDVVIEGGSVRQEARDPVSVGPGLAVAIADSSNIDIGPLSVECCAEELVAFIEHNDSHGGQTDFGEIRGITVRGLIDGQSSRYRKAPIRFETCSIPVEDIRLDGLDLEQMSGQKLISFPKCDGNYDNIRVQGRVGKLGRKAFAGVPEGIDLEVDLTAEDGTRARGAPRAVMRDLGR